MKVKVNIQDFNVNQFTNEVSNEITVSLRENVVYNSKLHTKGWYLVTEDELQQSSKPLKDQSYHQKRIADAIEELAKHKESHVQYLESGKAFADARAAVLSDNDWSLKYKLPNGKTVSSNSLSEEDVRRIVKEEIERPVYLNKEKGAVSLKDLLLSNFLVIEQQ